MYDAVGCQDVLVGNDGLPVEGQLFPTAAHVQGGAFQSLHRQASDDGLSTHGCLQDVMVQQVCKRGTCLSELKKLPRKFLQRLGILFDSKGLLHSVYTPLPASEGFMWLFDSFVGGSYLDSTLVFLHLAGLIETTLTYRSATGTLGEGIASAPLPPPDTTLCHVSTSTISTLKQVWAVQAKSWSLSNLFVQLLSGCIKEPFRCP